MQRLMSVAKVPLISPDSGQQTEVFFLFFFVVFLVFFAFLISASVCVRRPLPQNFSDTVSLAAANTTTTTRAKKRNNNDNYNGIKLNENYRTFAAAAHWRTRKFE